MVVDEYRVLNADGLRYADEFVKHKVLDAMATSTSSATRSSGRSPRTSPAMR